VDLGATVVADEQPLEVMEPGEGALDDPTDAAEAGAVLGLAASDDRPDAPLAHEAAVLVVVVAAVGDERRWATPGSADGAAHGRHLVEQRDQLGDVVAVTARERPGERDPSGIDQEVVLRPVSGSIDRARTGLGAPFFACTWLESAIAQYFFFAWLAVSLVKLPLFLLRMCVFLRCRSTARRCRIRLAFAFR
jgi:hypothetical protein